MLEQGFSSSNFYLMNLSKIVKENSLSYFSAFVTKSISTKPINLIIISLFSFIEIFSITLEGWECSL